MRIDGSIKTWNDDRGFGFIEPHNGGQEIFVHITAFSARVGRPEVGRRVTFEVEMTPDGKKRAKLVETIPAKRRTSRESQDNPAQWGTASYFAIPAFFVVYVLSSLLWAVPVWVGGFYLGISLLCFVVYAMDKSAARTDRWRVSEDTLLGLGIIGGWPGAIVAQQVLRHKSNKASARAKFWASVVLNVAAFVAFSSPLRTLLST